MPARNLPRPLERAAAAAAAAATDAEAATVAEQIRAEVRRLRALKWSPYPWQHPHVHPDGWVSTRVPGKPVCDERCALLPTAVPPTHGAWLQRGGRGTGKTEGAAHYVNAHVEGPPCDARVPGGHRITIVAPTQADAVTSCVTGVSGLQAINPGITVATTKEGTLARWPNGALARVVGAHKAADIDRLRAWTNVCLAWVEEAAAMPLLGGIREQSGSEPGALDQLPFTLRLGHRPHMVITTTPQNRPEVVAMIARHGELQTWGRTEDANRLEPTVRESLELTYRGTTLGQQELDGDLIADREGALWVQDRPLMVDGKPNPDNRPGIDNDKVGPDEIAWLSHRPEAPRPAAGVPLLERVIVAVDPPGGRTECGIVVVGRLGQHAYPIADLSTAGPPDTWARVVLGAYLDFGCEAIAAEHTYGGDMVTDVISSRVELLLATGAEWWPPHMGTPPVVKVPTKVGKRLRAEPVQGLYQQHRVHHLRGALPGTEVEQRQWVPDTGMDSPNRLDALVHGITHLLIRGGPAQIANPAGAGQRIASSFGTSRGLPRIPRP